eukprot:353082-Chlamydomonas_euryale.AAC.9
MSTWSPSVASRCAFMLAQCAAQDPMPLANTSRWVGCRSVTVETVPFEATEYSAGLAVWLGWLPGLTFGVCAAAAVDAVPGLSRVMLQASSACVLLLLTTATTAAASTRAGGQHPWWMQRAARESRAAPSRTEAGECCQRIWHARCVRCP